MHLLLLLLVIGLIIYALYSLTERPKQREQVSASHRRPLTYIADGLIFRVNEEGRTNQLHSPFVEEAMRRQERNAARHDWKAGTSFGVRAGGGMRDFGKSNEPFLATTVVCDGNGDLIYFMKDGSVGGLFRMEKESGRELRLALKQNLHLSGLAVSPDGDKLAAASHQPGQTANIALMSADGGEYREITGGDTLDQAPAWIPDEPDKLVFQSIGIARSPEGFVVGHGHSTIQLLDMTTGELTPVLEDRTVDFLSPRVSPDGSLLFIRRPYEAPHYGFAESLRDTLLFPFRLLRAVFHFLNVFSLMYSRKPLTSADNPGIQADSRELILQGRRIDAEKAVRNARPIQGVPSLVPDSWKLVSRSPSGQERIVATNVASFDLCADGQIIYSNGQGAFLLMENGDSHVVISGELVAEITGG